jgi:hypothetical protein
VALDLPPASIDFLGVVGIIALFGRIERAFLAAGSASVVVEAFSLLFGNGKDVLDVFEIESNIL